MLKEAIQKRYVGTMKVCSRVLMVKGCATTVLSAATDVRVRAAGFDFTAPYTDKVTAGHWGHNDGKVSVNFKKDQDYIEAHQLGLPDTKPRYTCTPNPLYYLRYVPDPEHSPAAGEVFYWSDETDAQEFADAFNRLLYAAYQGEESAAFRAAAQAWRENPVKPPLSPEADRHRILAENAIKEKDLASAVEHYESALEVQPMWAAGWFNLAIIYAEQNNYADATDRMKHYLELAPDAPDAKDAREQMVIWEDKAKH
jgi:tetratricopeptide (TPR) repeat protein